MLRTKKIPTGILRRKHDRLVRYQTYIKFCNTRNIPFNLNQREFSSIIEKGCHWCSQKNYLNGLMLKDFMKGYVVGNVNSICNGCLRKIMIYV